MKLGASLAVFVLLLGSDALAGPPPGPASDDASAVVASATSPAQSSKPLDKSAMAAAQQQLTKLLVKKSVTSRIDFPGYKAGIDLSPAGMWSPHDAAASIEVHGIGVKKGDQATITAIKLHDEYMEIHLDGGGAGVFAQGFGPDRSRALDKVEGGSRINLRFDRRITHGDVQDLGRIISYLEPVVDTGEIQRTSDMASTLAPAKTDAPAPIVSEASTFGAPLLDPVPQAKPAPAPTTTKPKSWSNVAPIESKAAEIPPVPAPASAAPITTPAPVPAPAPAAPIATPTPAPAPTPVARIATPTPAPAPTAAAAAPKPTTETVAATKIEIGMDRMTVFQLLGQPGYKRVDVSKEVPIEKWQYDLPANGKRIITFEDGKVLRVEDF